MKKHPILPVLSTFLSILLLTAPAAAHHVLGRPSYSLNEDSNTPPSMNMETQIGDYFVTAMVYPAFPKPGEAGRINLYATRLDNGKPLNADVVFSVRDDNWLQSNQEKLGAQVLDDNVYRQGFIFNEEGAYIITAAFEDGGQPYTIEFPLRVGSPLPVALLGIAAAGVLVLLAGVSFIQRKRLLRSKVSAARDERRGNSQHNEY